MPRPTATESRDTRAEILRAAFELFAEKGFAATSLRRIAQTVGVRESAIYHWFASKDAILDAVMEEFVAGASARLDRVVPRGRSESPLVTLRALAQFFIDEWSTPESRKLHRLMMSEGVRLVSEGKLNLDRLRAPWKMVEKILADVIDGGAEIKLASMEFIAPLGWYRQQLLMPELASKLPKAKEFVEAHVDFFLRAVRRSPK